MSFVGPQVDNNGPSPKISQAELQQWKIFTDLTVDALVDVARSCSFDRARTADAISALTGITPFPPNLQYFLSPRGAAREEKKEKVEKVETTSGGGAHREAGRGRQTVGGEEQSAEATTKPLWIELKDKIQKCLAEALGEWTNMSRPGPQGQEEKGCCLKGWQLALPAKSASLLPNGGSKQQQETFEAFQQVERPAAKVVKVLERINKDWSTSDKLQSKAVGFATAEDFVEGIVAIALYSGSPLVYVMNQALSNRHPDKDKVLELLQPLIQRLESTLERLPRKKAGTRYRGLSRDSDIVVGQVVTLNEFVSTTTDETVARSFAAAGGLSDQIWLMQTTSGVDISFASYFTGEWETLLPPGRTFTAAYVTPPEALRMLNTRSRIVVLQEQCGTSGSRIAQLSSTFSELIRLNTAVFVDPIVEVRHPRHPFRKCRVIAQFITKDVLESFSKPRALSAKGAPLRERIVVQGSAGTGKSTLLFEMFCEIHSKWQGDGWFAVYVPLRVVGSNGSGGDCHTIDAAVRSLLSITDAEFKELQANKRIALLLDSVDEAPANIVELLRSSPLVAGASLAVVSVRPEWLREQSEAVQSIQSWFGCNVFEVFPCDMIQEDIDAYIHRVSVAEATTLQRAFQLSDINKILDAVRAAQRQAVCPAEIDLTSIQLDQLAIFDLQAQYTDAGGGQYSKEVAQSKDDVITCCVHPFRALLRTPLEMWLAITAHRALEGADASIGTFDLYRVCLREVSRRELANSLADDEQQQSQLTPEVVEKHACDGSLQAFGIKSSNDLILLPNERIAKSLPVRRVEDGDCPKYEFAHKVFFDFYTALGLLESPKMNWPEALGQVDPIAASGVATMIASYLCTHNIGLTAHSIDILKKQGAPLSSVLALCDNAIIHTAVDKLLILFLKMSASSGDKQRLQQMCDQAERFLQEASKDEEDSGEVAITLDSLANAYGDLGNHQKKKELLKRALASFECHLGLKHPHVAKTLANLGNAYGDLGKHEKKKEHLERALKIEELHYGPENPNVAKTLVNLANACGSLGQAQRQKELLERALPLLERHLGPEHLEFAITLQSLGNAYGDLGDAQKQKQVLERALPLMERHLGPEHPEVAKALVNLGRAYGSLGKAQKMKELVERALVIEERHYGPGHPEIAKTLHNLGNAYGFLGNQQKKKELLERALAISERHFGSRHPFVAALLESLGNAYGLLGDAHKQKDLLERALGIGERCYGLEHPEVARMLMILGNAHGFIGNLHKQRDLLERALEIGERYYGRDHPEVAKTQICLGSTYGALGDVKRKKELIERALLILERHYGPEHPLVQNVSNIYKGA